MKIHRKILMSIITIVLLLITLSASTYAWIYNTTQVKLSGFDFQAVGGYGFQISVDDTHYQTSITTDQIKKAILYAQNSSSYEFDDEGNLVTIVTEGATSRALTDTEIDNAIKNIELRPMTSYNGYEFEGLGNTKLGDDYLSNCIEFSLYFKTVSDTKSDNLSYDIYLNGKEYTNTDGSVVKKTSLSSNYDEVTLTAPLTTFTKGLDSSGNLTLESNTYSTGNTIKVYSANAMRFSIDNETITYSTNTEYKLVEAVFEEPTYDEKTTYYSLNQDGTYSEISVTSETFDSLKSTLYVKIDNISSNVEHNNCQIFEFYNEDDLGSYATNYTKKNIASSDVSVTDSSGNVITTYDNNLGWLYDSSLSASFTYYNNKKSEVQKISPLSYSKLPSTVRHNINVDETYIGNKITTVTTGGGSQKVTFRFWLEGWDADCFDGIAKSISVNLAFVSKQIN